MKTYKLVFITLAIFMLIGSDVVWAQEDNVQHNHLKDKSGKWKVVITLTPETGAQPVIFPDIVADRTMIGEFCLHEIMQPATGAKTPAFTRLCDLAWNKNEQRWDYMSIDTRITAGIMYFTYQGGNNDSICSIIPDFFHPGIGPGQKGRGQAVYTRNEVIRINNDHDMVKQYWRLIDAKEWLAVQYDYTRQ